MRGIRVLSELTGRMRYASNKRVLAETAFLKLARPETETTEDALLERIRRLEQRLDELSEGGVVRVTEQEKEAEEPHQEEDADVLPEAAGEDLVKICSDWRRLVASMPSSILKQQLMENAHPQYNSETMENRLYVEFGGGAQETAAAVAVSDIWREAFERIIEKQYGRHVDVEFHLAKARPSGVRTVDVARMAEERMKMPVEIVEDDDDEDEIL